MEFPGVKLCFDQNLQVQGWSDNLTISGVLEGMSYINPVHSHPFCLDFSDIAQFSKNIKKD